MGNFLIELALRWCWYTYRANGVSQFIKLNIVTFYVGKDYQIFYCENFQNTRKELMKNFHFLPKKANTIFLNCNPPASKASKEVAHLIERNNLHTPHMVSKNLSVCMSVCDKLWPQLFQKLLIYDFLAGNNKDFRLESESFWINKLRTKSPDGLNKNHNSKYISNKRFKNHIS